MLLIKILPVPVNPDRLSTIIFELFVQRPSRTIASPPVDGIVIWSPGLAVNVLPERLSVFLLLIDIVSFSRVT